MSSHRETVIPKGHLEGMGHEAGCTVGAVKVSLPLLNIWEYVRCSIHHAPVDLPDGQHQVTFEGRTMQVKKLEWRLVGWEYLMTAWKVRRDVGKMLTIRLHNQTVGLDLFDSPVNLFMNTAQP
jgi:hypothetical protein